jgi:hypothetical protein
MDVPSQCTIVRTVGRSAYGSGLEDKTHKISERSSL